MSTFRLSTILVGLIFLCIAALALYRLFFGFRMSIGGLEIGQTSTFFVFVICAALSLILLRGRSASG